MNKKLLNTFSLSFLLVLSQVSFTQTLTDSLKAHFKFDKSTLDSSPTQCHLLNDSALDWTTFFQQDLAIHFDGTTRAQSIGSFDNSYFTQTAISLWINTNYITNQHDQTLLQGSYLGFGLLFNTRNELAVFFRAPFSNALTDTTNISDGMWHHIVAQNNGDSTFLFIDGILKGKKKQQLSVGTGSPSNKLYMGNTNLNAKPYIGSINDLRIYSRILTKSEIDSLSAFPTLAVSNKDISIENEKLVSVYPNPSSGVLNIRVDNLFIGGNLILRNIKGQIIQHQQITRNKIPAFEIKGASGLYFAEVISINGYSKIIKLIKE